MIQDSIYMIEAMDKNVIAGRLAALRDVLRREHLAAYIIPSSDPHASEYVADHWKCREWISGFDGSAGTVVVTMTAAALWTDSRYFIAAAEQLHGTEYQLMKERVDGTPTIAEWIADQLQHSDSTEVALDGMVACAADVEDLIADLRHRGGITVRTNLDVFATIWTDRPPVPMSPLRLHPLKYAGEDTPSKLLRIRKALRALHADGMLVAALDDIAWTLNLRGADIHCNPVFVAYLLISSTQTTLFVHPDKVPLEVRAYLADCHVDIDDYDHLGEALRSYFEYNILVDPAEVCYTLFQKAARHTVVRAASPIPAMKAVKNEVEQEGYRRAMVRDGVAMVRFLHWLDDRMQHSVGEWPTELSAAKKLEELRSEQEGYIEPSFDTISAYQAHGAIVHYEPTPSTSCPLRPEGFLLVDSGAQYSDGTTDITRTIPLGPLTEEQKKVYTIVLKGHIQLQLACFPDGCTGTQIDALAREPLWREGMNFLHGTGHGVGSCLCVHEGPHQVRMNHVPAPLHAGMTITDEPGIYLEGRFGVRIENVLLIRPYVTTESGDFLCMETLTLCPIDTRPVIASMLTGEERHWLNSYNRRVCEQLSPLLADADREWLERCCK